MHDDSLTILFTILVSPFSLPFRPEALLLAEYMHIDTIYVTENLDWPGRPTITHKNLRIIGRKGAGVTLHGKWLLAEDSSGTFENLSFTNGQFSSVHSHLF